MLRFVNSTTFIVREVPAAHFAPLPNEKGGKLLKEGRYIIYTCEDRWRKGAYTKVLMKLWIPFLVIGPTLANCEEE
jgi:hypothetical protein